MARHTWTRFLWIGALLLYASAPVQVKANPPVVDITAGTLGAALSVSKAIDEHTLVRLEYGTYDIHRQQRFDNVVIDVTARLRLNETFRLRSVSVDLERALIRPLHFTAGLLLNQNHIHAISVPSDSSITINGSVYSATQAGNIFTDIAWTPVSPYIGLGIGSRLSDRRHVAFIAEFGGYYQGKARVSFAATGAISANRKQFEKYFDDEQRQLTTELAPFEVFPVGQIGMRITF